MKSHSKAFAKSNKTAIAGFFILFYGSPSCLPCNDYIYLKNSKTEEKKGKFTKINPELKYKIFQKATSPKGVFGKYN